jgi:hypothetical protein
VRKRETAARTPYIIGSSRPVSGRPARLFTAMQHHSKIGFQALELMTWIVMIAARSCGANAPAGISRQ